MMNSKIYSLEEIRAIAAPIAKKYGITALYLFGSSARGEASVQSDIDLRIDRGPIRSLLTLGGLYSDLGERFSKPLDLVTTQSLSPSFLDSIKDEEVLLYAQA